METRFDQFMREIEAEVLADGPEAVEQLEAFHVHFGRERRILEGRLSRTHRRSRSKG